MTIAIIGGEGFLGKRLKNNLDEKGIEYSNFDLAFPKSHQGFIDVNNIGTLEKLSKFKTIINLSAVHQDNIRPIKRYYDVNVEGAKNICSIASKYEINNIIFSSSVAIYGFAPKDTDESGFPNYFNDYGKSKYLAEEIYKDWYLKNEKNRTLTIVRPTVIFGEGNRGNFYNLSNQIAKKRFIMVGNGKNLKSICYVENVAAFFTHCLSLKKGLQIINYVDKPDMTMNELVFFIRKHLFKKNSTGLRLPFFLAISFGLLIDLFVKVSGLSFSISSQRIRKFTQNTSFVSSRKDLGFKPPYTLEQGLKKTLDYEFLNKK